MQHERKRTHLAYDKTNVAEQMSQNQCQASKISEEMSENNRFSLKDGCHYKSLSMLDCSKYTRQLTEDKSHFVYSGGLVMCHS